MKKQIEWSDYTMKEKELMFLLVSAFDVIDPVKMKELADTDLRSDDVYEIITDPKVYKSYNDDFTDIVEQIIMVMDNERVNK